MAQTVGEVDHRFSRFIRGSDLVRHARVCTILRSRALPRNSPHVLSVFFMANKARLHFIVCHKSQRNGSRNFNPSARQHNRIPVRRFFHPARNRERRETLGGPPRRQGCGHTRLATVDINWCHRLPVRVRVEDILDGFIQTVYTTHSCENARSSRWKQATVSRKEREMVQGIDQRSENPQQ